MTTSRGLRSVLAAACTFALVLGGCGDDDSDDATGGGSSSSSSSGGGTPTGAYVGLWRISVVTPRLEGFVLPFQLEVAESGAEGATTWTLRAVAIRGGAVEPNPMSVVEGVVVSDDGSFEVDFGEMVIPGAYSVTSTDIALTVTFIGQSREGGFCGTLRGDVPSVNLTLNDATFGGGPWDATELPEPSCGGDGNDLGPFDRLDPADCPDITEGMNTGFESAGVARTFQVHLPSDFADAEDLALVFQFHGLGGDIEGMVNYTDLHEAVDDRDFVLVTPQGRGLQAQEWQQLSNDDSPDLAMFDDLVTCAQESFSIDPNKIFVTGMSGGGLYTSHLAKLRAGVIAAAAPMSGGFLSPFVTPDDSIPILMGWGGPSDMAVGQNFDNLASEMQANWSNAGGFLVTCNHGEGHSWPDEMSDTILDFLFAHPEDVTPLPYSGGLPDSYPSYCTIASGD